MAERRITAIVLAGGEGRRFGGDKLAAPYAGATVLDHLLDRLPRGWSVVCVGPVRPTARDVRWTREDPPGGGPVAGVAAGLAAVATDADTVLLLAGDQPEAANAAARLAAHLAEAPAEVGAVVAADRDGRINPLLTAFRREALEASVPAQPAGRAARALLDGLRVVEVAIDPAEQHDIDRPADL